MTGAVDTRRRERAASPVRDERLSAALAALRLTERNLDHLITNGRPDQKLLMAWREIVRASIRVGEQ